LPPIYYYGQPAKKGLAVQGTPKKHHTDRRAESLLSPLGGEDDLLNGRRLAYWLGPASRDWQAPRLRPRVHRRIGPRMITSWRRDVIATQEAHA